MTAWPTKWLGPCSRPRVKERSRRPPIGRGSVHSAKRNSTCAGCGVSCGGLAVLRQGRLLDLPVQAGVDEHARDHLEPVLQRADVDAQQAGGVQQQRAGALLDHLVAGERQPAVRHVAGDLAVCGARDRGAAGIEQVSHRGRAGPPPSRDRRAARAPPAPPARSPRGPPAGALSTMPETITRRTSGGSPAARRACTASGTLAAIVGDRRRVDLEQVGLEHVDLDAVALGVAARRLDAADLVVDGDDRRPAEQRGGDREHARRRSRGRRRRRWAASPRAAPGTSPWSGASPRRTRRRASR